MNAAAVEKTASGTVLPPAASLGDDDGHVWTLADDRANMDGRVIYTGSRVPIVLLLFYRGTIYAKNVDGDWFRRDPPWTPLGANDPRTQAVAYSNTSLFYGINGHMAWGSGIYHTMPVEQQLAILKDLGVTMYRCDVADPGMSRTIERALLGSFAGSGVGILPVLNPRSAYWNPLGSEDDAYALGYNLAVRCTQPLAGLVRHIECGNELDTVGLQIGGDGSQSSDWSPQQWPSFRGVIRGMIDGVRAVDSTIQCGVNVGIPMAYRALQMLWGGIQPDGSPQGAGGASPLRWDYTTYHWYHSSGDIQCAGRYRECVNILQVLKESFGVPIWLTEYGWSGANDGQEAASTYLGQVLAEYRAAKDQYGVQSIMLYELIDADFGLIQGDGVTRNRAYETFRQFVAGNGV
nr:glycosyl hydrolase [Candidatus Burkholderia verschuerenii]